MFYQFEAVGRGSETQLQVFIINNLLSMNVLDAARFKITHMTKTKWIVIKNNI